MITGSYDFDTVEEAFNVDLKIELTFKKLVFAKARCSKCEGYEHYDYQCPSKSQHVSDDVDESKVVEDVFFSSETTSIIEDIPVGSDTPILDESNASYEGTGEIMDVIVKSDTPLTVDAHVHGTNDVVPELVEFSVSSQIVRYSFATPLIEDEIDHEIVNFSVVTSSGPGPFESSCADYDFMVIPTDSFSSESSEFLAMIPTCGF